MKTKGVFLVLLIFILGINNYCFSQKGTPFISNFNLSKQTQNVIWDIAEGEKDEMYFANRDGVFAFDGNIWEIIDISFSPTVIKQTTNAFLVGGNKSLGMIINDDKGNYIFRELFSSVDSIGYVTEIVEDSNLVYLNGENVLTIIDNKNFKITGRFFTDTENPFTNIIKLKNRMFIMQMGKGLFEIKNDSLVVVLKQSELPDNELIMSFNFSIGKVLLGYDNSTLYTFNGSKISEYKIENQEYLTESILEDGIALNKELLVLTTLNGGAMIIEKKTGKTKFTLNFQTGLPDDEIFSVGKDNNGGLWLSHEYGLSRIEMQIPVYTFNNYPGLSGNLNDIMVFNNILYVSTSDGVYRLIEKKDYSEKEITIKIKRKPQNTVKPKPVQKEKKPEIDISKLSKKERRRLKWAKVKNKIVNDISESIVTVANSIQETQEEPAEKTQNQYKYIRKKIYSLQSISHQYNKIDGLNFKCKDLLRINKMLLVTSNNGLYEITGESVEPIIENIYVYKAYANDSLVYIASNQGIFRAKKMDNKGWLVNKVNNSLSSNIYSIAVYQNYLLASDDNFIYKINLNDSTAEYNKYIFNSKYSLKAIIQKLNDKPLFFTQAGVYELENDSLIKVDNNLFNDATEFIFSQNDRVWLKSNDNWYGLSENNVQLELNPVYLNLVNNVKCIYTENGEVIWAINNNNTIYKINNDIIKSKNFNVYIKYVKNQEGDKIPLTKLRVDFNKSALQFVLSAPYFISQEGTQYQYFVKGLMSDWSAWSNSTQIDFPFIPSGNYEISIRAKNIFGFKTEFKKISFIVKPPFWTSWWFYLLVILAFFAVVYFVFQLRTKKLQHDKKILEQKVKERTVEIERQKEEIIDQKDEIEAQRDMVTDQRDEILNQKEEITASIMYAQRIQEAVLPPESLINESLPNHFILFKPRDIVSGDFYWMKKIGDITIITAADCTGHGVPGAFMSMLGMTMLNDIVRKKEVKQASHVLEELRQEIKISLRQTGKEGEAKDGMDIALCVIDHKKKTLQFAGAYNPLYLYRDNELIEIKANRMPIGVYIKDNEPFVNHKIDLKKGDTFYLFSDGYVDQFGGEKNNKFKTKAFKQLLLEIHKKQMPEQKEILNTTFENWKGKNNQIDDVLVIGIKY